MVIFFIMKYEDIAVVTPQIRQPVISSRPILPKSVAICLQNSVVVNADVSVEKDRVRASIWATSAVSVGGAVLKIPTTALPKR